MKAEVKWITLENETAERVLKQHGFVSRICKDKWTGDPYPGNISLCRKLAVSEDGERSIPWIRIDGERVKDDCCQICWEKYNHKQCNSPLTIQ